MRSASFARSTTRRRATSASAGGSGHRRWSALCASTRNVDAIVNRRYAAACSGPTSRGHSWCARLGGRRGRRRGGLRGGRCRRRGGRRRLVPREHVDERPGAQPLRVEARVGGLDRREALQQPVGAARDLAQRVVLAEAVPVARRRRRGQVHFADRGGRGPCGRRLRDRSRERRRGRRRRRTRRRADVFGRRRGPRLRAAQPPSGETAAGEHDRQRDDGRSAAHGDPHARTPRGGNDAPLPGDRSRTEPDEAAEGGPNPAEFARGPPIWLAAAAAVFARQPAASPARTARVRGAEGQLTHAPACRCRPSRSRRCRGPRRRVPVGLTVAAVHEPPPRAGGRATYVVELADPLPEIPAEATTSPVSRRTGTRSRCSRRLPAGAASRRSRRASSWTCSATPRPRRPPTPSRRRCAASSTRPPADRRPPDGASLRTSTQMVIVGPGSAVRRSRFSMVRGVRAWLLSAQAALFGVLAACGGGGGGGGGSAPPDLPLDLGLVASTVTSTHVVAVANPFDAVAVVSLASAEGPFQDAPGALPATIGPRATILVSFVVVPGSTGAIAGALTFRMTPSAGGGAAGRTPGDPRGRRADHDARDRCVAPVRRRRARDDEGPRPRRINDCFKNPVTISAVNVTGTAFSLASPLPVTMSPPAPPR